jgi:hypothetical protein
MPTRGVSKRACGLVSMVRRVHRSPHEHVVLRVPIYCAINSLSFVMTNVVKMEAECMRNGLKM